MPLYKRGSGLMLRRRLHADVLRWRAQILADGGTVTATEVAACNAQVRFINGNGVRSVLKRFNPQYGNAIAQRVCVYSDWGTATRDTIQGSPTIGTRGMVIDGSTKFVRTGIIPISQSGWNGQDCHIGCHLTEGNDTGANRAIFGCWSNAGAKRLGLTWQSNVAVANHGVNGESSNATRTLGVLSGHLCSNAKSGTGTSYWENGVNTAGAGVYGTNPTAATSAGWPSTELTIGNADSAGMAGACVLAGYHVGTGLTAAQALLMAECMAMGAQMAGRQETWGGCGESTTAPGSSQWCTLLQTNYLPRRAFTRVATGGIQSSVQLTNFTNAIAANPCLKYLNWTFLTGVNDSSIGGWNGANTVSNVAAMRALLPHAGFRVMSVIPQNRTSDYTGGAVRTVKDSVNSQWSTLYGAKYVNINTPLIAGGTGSGQDLVDQTNGVIPSSLKVSTSWSINDITKANPARLQINSTHTAAVGDVVTVSGVVGMTAINGRSAYITFASSSFINMVGTDSSAYATYVSGGTATGYDATHLGASGDTVIANTVGTSIATGWL